MVKKREMKKDSYKLKSKDRENTSESEPASSQTEISQKKETPKEKSQKKQSSNGEEPAGQFLFTYGWAILVIIAAIGTIFYSSIFSGITIERCSIPRSSGLSCDSFEVSNGAILLNITNLLDETVVVTKLSELLNNNNSCRLNSDSLILAKNTTSLLFNEKGSIGSCATLLSNPKIMANINITYKDVNLTSRTAKGRLVVKST